jgi:hypothetical protein
MTSQRIQTVRPFGAVWLKPRVQISKRFTVQTVKAPLCVGTHHDQAGVAQDPQVPRNSRLVHAKLLNQFADRTFLRPNGVQYSTSSRLRNGFQYR